MKRTESLIPHIEIVSKIHTRQNITRIRLVALWVLCSCRLKKSNTSGGNFSVTENISIIYIFIHLNRNNLYKHWYVKHSIDKSHIWNDLYWNEILHTFQITKYRFDNGIGCEYFFFLEFALPAYNSTIK